MRALELKLSRTRLKLTIAQMARCMGVSRGTYDKWEKGDRRISAAAARLVETLLWLQEVGWFDNFFIKFEGGER